MTHRFKHLAEAALFLLAYGVSRALPLDAASSLGGRLLACIGPRLKKLSHTARTNIAIAFPEKTVEEQGRTFTGMWDNLGRVAAEFAHAGGMTLFSRVSISGMENIPLRGTPALFVSAHYGNWELTYPVAYEYGVPVTLIYRHANNPYIEQWINRIRKNHASGMLPKGLAGATRLGKTLRRGGSVAMMIDQKMNEGIPVPFFGREAMTAPAVAQFALRFGMPVIPVRVVCLKGAHFKVNVYPPLAIVRTGDKAADEKMILAQLNAMLEGWIREHPEQWYWVHRRFDKSVY